MLQRKIRKSVGVAKAFQFSDELCSGLNSVLLAEKRRGRAERAVERTTRLTYDSHRTQSEFFMG